MTTTVSEPEPFLKYMRQRQSADALQYRTYLLTRSQWGRRRFMVTAARNDWRVK